MKRITDKQRLDFLEREGLEIFMDDSHNAGDERWIVGSEGGWMPTVRKAIDAAIKQSRREP